MNKAEHEKKRSTLVALRLPSHDLEFIKKQADNLEMDFSTFLRQIIKKYIKTTQKDASIYPK